MHAGRLRRMTWLAALVAAALAVVLTGCDDDGGGGPVGPSGDPDAPELLAPADGAQIDLAELADTGAELLIDWSDVDGAAFYRLEIAADAGFSQSSLIYEVDVDSVDAGGARELPSEFVPQVNRLAINVTHYWRVKVVWADGSETGWSEVYSFRPFAEAVGVDEVLAGEITTDKTLSGDKAYLLRGGVFVGFDEPARPEVTLVIEPGCTIMGESASDGMLVIRRTGRIEAEGTASEPIVFTSDRANPGRGDWGGVIINGEARLNTGAEAYGEGDTGPYGGEFDNDDSGVIRYVRIEYAGREISPDNELNGLALQGVGSGSTIEYIQVHMNKDDGIEFFGGTVNARYIYITGCADDQFDWTDGWRGMGQFWVCQQYTDDADQGIEADNNGEQNTATPVSGPTLYNLTLIGAQGASGESDIGVLLREGTGATIENAIVMNFGEAAVDIDDEFTFENAWDEGAGSLNGRLVLDHSIFYTNNALTTGDDESGYPFTTGEFLIEYNAHNWTTVDPELAHPLNAAAPDFAPAGGSLALDPGNAADPTVADDWFEPGQYVGAFDGSTNWLAGWTRGR